MAAQIFPFLFLPFKSYPLVGGTFWGKKGRNSHIVHVHVHAHGLLWLSFVKFYLSLWSSSGIALSLTHTSFTRSLELYVINVFTIKPLKEKLLCLRWYKQDKHTKASSDNFLSNIRNKNILAPVL